MHSLFDSKTHTLLMTCHKVLKPGQADDQQIMPHYMRAQEKQRFITNTLCNAAIAKLQELNTIDRSRTSCRINILVAPVITLQSD